MHYHQTIEEDISLRQSKLETPSSSVVFPHLSLASNPVFSLGV